jgi:hypothetical protein
MKTYVHLWQYLAELFLEWEMFQKNFAEKIKTRILCSNFFSLKIAPFMWQCGNKCGRTGEAADENIILRMRTTCWITKATHTHSEYVILIAFLRQQLLQENTSILRYTYIACTATMVTRKHLNITLYVHCLHGNNGYTKTPQYYAIRTLPARQQWLHENTSILRYKYIACTATMVIRKHLNITLYVHCLHGNNGYTKAPLYYAISTLPARQQWLHESTSILRYTYIASLLITVSVGIH